MSDYKHKSVSYPAIDLLFSQHSGFHFEERQRLPRLSSVILVMMEKKIELQCRNDARRFHERRHGDFAVIKMMEVMSQAAKMSILGETEYLKVSVGKNGLN